MGIRVAVGTSSFAQENDAPLRMLEAKGIEVVPNPFGRRLTEDETIEHLKDIDGLIAGLEPLNRRVLAAAAPRLKAVARVGIGVANVDFDAAKDLDIKVSNTPEGPTQAVAEMTLTAMLALCRRLLPVNAAVHAGEWKKMIGTGLSGSKVLLIGYGRIGRRVGDLLRAFGAEILIADPFIAPASLNDGERLVALDAGLAEADVVTLHAAGENVILGAEQIALMKDGAVLLNSARGELVDEQALIEALESGKLAGVWFDSLWQEPYSGRLIEFDQAILTPHVGTYTAQCRRDMESAAVANLLRDLGIED